MPDSINDFVSFMQNSPTPFHCVEEMKKRLEKKKFLPLLENKSWGIAASKDYYIERNGSLLSFKTPKEKIKKAVIFLSHTDSPALKLKPNAYEESHGMGLLNTEVYGGPILRSYLNRDLHLAGIAIYKTKSGEIQKKLLHFQDTPVVIPDLAIHLNKEVNSKPEALSKQNHLKAILGINLKGKNPLKDLIQKEIGKNELLHSDIFVVPSENPTFFGIDQNVLGSYRIDNLVSVHSCMEAFLQTKTRSVDTLYIHLAANHEEIGSMTNEGAASPFLMDSVQRIVNSLGLKQEEFYQVKSNSLCISLDVVHGMHPLYADKHDIANTPKLGDGIVIKQNANYKYASSIDSVGYLVDLCKTAKIKHQFFSLHSDQRGGSTLGPISTTHTGIDTIDIGTPHLSMHSAKELMHTHDYTTLVELIKKILSNK